MAFIINLRTPTNTVSGASGAILGNGLQVTDLWPSASQRNQNLDPQPNGPVYCKAPLRLQRSDLQGVGTRSTRARVSGLVPFLLENLQYDPAAGLSPQFNLTPDQAFSIANGLIDSLETLPADLDFALDFILSSVLGGAPSKFLSSMDLLLAVLSGLEYTTPKGTQFNAYGQATLTVASNVPGGESFTINGAVSETYTEGLDFFAGLTTEETATNIADAINSLVPSLLVRASASGSVVTLTALSPGVGGNYNVTTSNPAVFTVNNLTGGQNFAVTATQAIEERFVAFRQLSDTDDSLLNSMRNGQLHTLMDPNLSLYQSDSPHPVVSVYDNSGLRVIP